MSEEIDELPDEICQPCREGWHHHCIIKRLSMPDRKTCCCGVLVELVPKEQIVELPPYDDEPIPEEEPDKPPDLPDEPLEFIE